jgi:hypothetical protein
MCDSKLETGSDAWSNKCGVDGREDHLPDTLFSHPVLVVRHVLVLRDDMPTLPGMCLALRDSASHSQDAKCSLAS